MMNLDTVFFGSIIAFVLVILLGRKIRRADKMEQQQVLSILINANREMTIREIEQASSELTGVQLILAQLRDQGSVIIREEMSNTTRLQTGGYPKIYYRAQSISPDTHSWTRHSSS